MFGNLLQSLVNVIDVFMVGRLGPIAIAAVGMSTAIRMLVLVLLLSVAAGAMSLIAQARGANDLARMSFVTRQALSSGVLLSLVLTVAGLLLAEPLLRLTNGGGQPEAVHLGKTYLQILFLGTPFLVLNVVLEKLMQGAGDTVTPLLLSGSLNVMNIGFNAVFIFGLGPVPAFGIAGAALGTVLARFLSVVIAFTLIRSGRNVVKLLPGSYRPDLRMFKDIFSIGVPSGIQGLFRNGSRLLVIGIVTSTEVGTYGAAALAIGFQVESLAFMPGLGINVAATSLVGQALGHWQPEEARRRGNTAILFGLGVMVLIAVPIVVFAPFILHLFDPSANPLLLKAGLSYLRINTLALPITAIAIIANGALRGAGDSVPGMVSTILTRGIVTVGSAYLLAFSLGLGAVGVWYALVIGICLDSLYMGLRWRGQAWQKVALHKSQVYRQHLSNLPEAVQARYLREVRAPLMAQPDVLEQVESESVVYKTPEGDVRVRFGAGGYQLLPSKLLQGALGD